MGSNITLENFEGPIITFKGTGTTFPVHIISYCEMLHRLLNDDNWTQALRLCRRANVNKGLLTLNLSERLEAKMLFVNIIHRSHFCTLALQSHSHCTNMLEH